MNVPSSNASRRELWWGAVVLALIGLGLAVELTRIHVGVLADPSHRSFCNVNATVNCDAVAESSYSMLLGLPLSVWGMFGYTAAAVFSWWGLRGGRRAAVAGLWLIGAVCSIGALALAAISAFALKTWCLLCMATWLVDFGLFSVAALLARGEGLRSCFEEFAAWLRSNRAVTAGWVIAGAAALWLTYQSYRSVGAAPSPRVLGASPAHLNQAHEGTDEHGLPYVGAKAPKLVITEFSDYQCPHCAMAHEQLRALVSAYPEAIRVVHRHFPLDNDCNPEIKQLFHTHACYYARLAICSALLGKFWVGNDYLFKHGRDEDSVAIDSFARAIEAPPETLRECLKNRADSKLKQDVEAGIKLEIDGTPTFVIRGEKHMGALPADVLRDYPLPASAE